MIVQQFLEQQHVPFEPLEHRATHNARSLAMVIEAPGDIVAKAVLLRTNEGYVLAVLPATHTVDLAKAKAAVGVEVLALATEAECGYRFGDCELGALPPFGSRYGMRTLVDRSLAECDEIIFEGNTHHEAIRMKYSDYESVEHPLVGDFSHPI